VRVSTLVRVLVVGASLVAAAASAVPDAANNGSGPKCKTGVRCGDACIARGKRCTK
jgi:hypothetical protein